VCVEVSECLCVKWRTEVQNLSPDVDSTGNSCLQAPGQKQLELNIISAQIIQAAIKSTKMDNG